MKIPTICLLLSLATFILMPFSSVAFGPQDKPDGFTTLAIGDPAPDFSLPGVDGKNYTLSDFAGPDVLMIYFTGTHCPTSNGVEGRLQKLVDDMQGKSFGLVAINPNHSSGLRPDEFGHTEYDETFEDSKRYAEDLGWEFPYLYDGNEQLTARAYGCLATPHVFIFDKERKLRYNGRFDDSRFPDPATVKSPDARNAVEALLAGQPVPVETTRPHGCSTKWKERAAHVAEEEEEWQNAEAKVAAMGVEELQKLRANESGRVRLFNVWATWCQPCTEEFPDLTQIARKFSRRDFDFITISLDNPGTEKSVEKFLGKHRAVLSAKQKKAVEAEGRTTNNYLWTSANNDDLAAALDPDWPGPIPYTILVDQNGEVVYRHVGVIVPEELTAAILETMTTYHQPKPVTKS
ncbi:MAG: redoxin domain-containing protein [Verrucomicrobiota bacterium]